MQRSQAIPIYIGTPLGGTDPRAHFWYHSPDSEPLRLCDDVPWPQGKLPRLDDSAIYVPCDNCKGLYVEDILWGEQWLEPHPYIDPSPNCVVYSPNEGEPLYNKEGDNMDKPIAISTFARYYESTDSLKWRIVENFLSPQRDFYWALRNALAETHWQSDDISTFEAALGGLVASLRSPAQRDHYRKLGENYISFWKSRPGAHVFTVPIAETEIAGLRIRVNPEIGMAYGSDYLALKLYLRAKSPTRKYREAMQHITNKAKQHAWNPNWLPVLFDVRRQDPLVRIPLPTQFDLAIEAQAVAFLHTMERLREQAASQES